MDSLTQAALGAIVGERALGKQLGRKAIFWGALLGTLPDLDVLANPWLDEIGQLYWHRGFSHSVLGVCLGTPLFTWLLWRWWNRSRAVEARPGRARIGWKRVGVFVFLNFASHVLIDCFTMYGTQLLEPFSSRRFGLNNFFIIDLIFTLPLLLWIGVALLSGKVPGRASAGWARGCGLVLAGYVGFSFTAQAVGAKRFEKELAAAGIVPLRGEVSAAPFTTLVWRGLFETEDAFWIGYWAVTDSEEPLEFYEVPKRLELLKPYEGDRAVDCALWFSEGYLLVTPYESGPGFVATDLRFTEFWPEEADGLPRTFFSWRIVPSTEERERSEFQMLGGSDEEFGDLLRQILGTILARVKGDRGAFGPESVHESAVQTSLRDGGF